MNEYTRREEVRATFIASAILVLCIAVAVFRLVTVEGRLVPDPSARRQAQESEQRLGAAIKCSSAAKQLAEDVGYFGRFAEKLKLNEPPPPPPEEIRTQRRTTKKAPPPPPLVPWSSAQQLHKQARVVTGCREGTMAALNPARPQIEPTWKAIADIAALQVPTSDRTEDKTAEDKATRQAYTLASALLKPEGMQPLLAATADAEAAYRAEAERDRSRASTAVVREPLPEGLMSRRTAVTLGVALTVIALLVSYLSVRVASMRRLATLVPLRDAARTGSPGAQTAAILKAAAAHNGGEPGLVIGSAVGGLGAALLKPGDADLFVAGVMAGLLIGLAIQWVIRVAIGAGRWRARSTELAEIEKPAIPIVLVMSGVNPGLEAQFIQYLRSLSPEDAANAVEKLASQAEERILAAAEAQRSVAHQAGAGQAM